METSLEINPSLFLYFGAAFIIISAMHVMELSSKTGIIRVFEKTNNFETRNAMIKRRYFLIFATLLFWFLSYLSFWCHLFNSSLEKKIIWETMNYFLVGSFIVLVSLYITINALRPKPSQFEKDINDIGKN